MDQFLFCQTINYNILLDFSSASKETRFGFTSSMVTAKKLEHITSPPGLNHHSSIEKKIPGFAFCLNRIVFGWWVSN